MKISLDQTYLYAGKFYGPGDVEIEDEAAAKAIAAKVAAAAKASRGKAIAAAADAPADEKPARKGT